MSDRFANRLFSGNFAGLREAPGQSQSNRRLVEECEIVSVHAIQKAFGKKVLIAAIRDCRPLRLPVPGGHFDVWLIEEPHRLPGRIERWASLEAGTSRLWLFCLGCRRRVAKLFYYHVAPSSSGRSDLLCRLCHGLTYQSVNCGGNRWYREVARPMKRLLWEKQRLLSKRDTRCLSSRLAQIDEQIKALRRRVKVPSKREPQDRLSCLAVRKRRPYRNLALLE